MQIRAAIPADAAEIGRVHVASLRSSHAGLLPEQFLTDLSVEKRAAVWRELLTERAATHFIFIAQDSNGIVGFCAGGPESSKRQDYPGEIYTLYLLSEAHGQGIGRKLLTAAFEQFKLQGIERVMLWVLKDNLLARGFYDDRIQAAVSSKEIYQY